VVNVLQPFKIGAGHTTSIAEEIGADDDTFLDENFLSGKCGGSISSLNNDFALEIGCIALVD